MTGRELLIMLTAMTDEQLDRPVIVEQAAGSDRLATGAAMTGPDAGTLILVRLR